MGFLWIFYSFFDRNKNDVRGPTIPSALLTNINAGQVFIAILYCRTLPKFLTGPRIDS